MKLRITAKAKKPTHKEIADALGVSRVRVTQLAKSGMATESIAEAQAWIAKRKGRPTPSADADSLELPQVAPVDAVAARGLISDLEARISRAEALADAAQRRAQNEIETGDGEAAKKAGDLAGSSQRTLLLLERELRQRRIDAGDLVPMAAAGERFGKVLGEILAAIDAGEAALCAEANPDNPGRAAKAFRRFRDNVRRKVSAAADNAPR